MGRTGRRLKAFKAKGSQRMKKTDPETEYIEAHLELRDIGNNAKNAFKAFIVFYNKGESKLAKKRHEKFRGSIKKLIEFWRGDPMEHTAEEFYDIKALHLFNGFEDPDVPEFEILWRKYIQYCLSFRCQLMYITHTFKTRH